MRIYGQDAERKQTLEEAGLTYRAMVDTYTVYGYELIELPKAPSPSAPASSSATPGRSRARARA